MKISLFIVACIIFIAAPVVMSGKADMLIPVLKLFHQYRYVITSITNNFNICKRMDRGQ